MKDIIKQYVNKQYPDYKFKVTKNKSGVLITYKNFMMQKIDEKYLDDPHALPLSEFLISFKKAFTFYLKPHKTILS